MELIWYIVIGVGLLALYIIISLIIGKLRSKVIDDEIQEIAKTNQFNYLKEKNKKYDYLLSNDSYDIYIRLITIPSNSSVTINSKETWCLRWGGKRVGRGYPNMRYLDELGGFLKSNITSVDKETIRLVLLYPGCEVILKYLNESEIATVTPESINHGFKAFKYDELKNHFNDLFITKEKK